MRWIETPLSGAFVLEPDRKEDDRGYFARTWCEFEAAEHGIDTKFLQWSVSFNLRARTLRGLHFQALPLPEAKLVRCTRGAAWDVMVDLRSSSPTFGRWFGVDLDEDSGRGVYIPAGFAHGFQTLLDETELLYGISQTYHAELARGIRWDDEDLSIPWPECSGRVISERDRQLPALKQCIDRF